MENDMKIDALSLRKCTFFLEDWFICAKRGHFRRSKKYRPWSVKRKIMISDPLDIKTVVWNEG